MRALLAVATLAIACDHTPTSRCVLDGADLLGPVERGPECSVTFDGSGSVTGVIDLRGEGLKLFFADGCPIGVRRVLRVAPEWSEVFTQRESDTSGELLLPPTTGTGLRFDLSVQTPSNVRCLTTAYVTVYRGQAGRESDFRSQDL